VEQNKLQILCDLHIQLDDPIALLRSRNKRRHGVFGVLRAHSSMGLENHKTNFLSGLVDNFLFRIILKVIIPINVRHILCAYDRNNGHIFRKQVIK
jgi:hypothetical protein